MAEKKQGVSYESVMKDLKARNFSPVYLLMGDESYYIDKICDYLMEHALQPEERDFNQVVLFGSPSVGKERGDRSGVYQEAVCV